MARIGGFNIYRNESRWKIAIETWAMLGFITWILYYSGRLESPLVNLYLLTIVTSALTLSVAGTGVLVSGHMIVVPVSRLDDYLS